MYDIISLSMVIVGIDKELWLPKYMPENSYDLVITMFLKSSHILVQCYQFQKCIQAWDIESIEDFLMNVIQLLHQLTHKYI